MAFKEAVGQEQNVQADFEASQTTGCGQLSVQFTDKSAGNPSSWQWDFGNGNASTDQNPSAVYASPGTYPVTLTVSNGVSLDKKIIYITVYQPPVVDFSLTPTSGCYPLNVQFTDKSQAGTGTITDWTWDFGDGSPFSTEQNPTHLYTGAGKFNVKLSVTNSAGCTNSSSLPDGVITNQGITVDFTADDTVSCSAPLRVHFTASTSSRESIVYNWDFGDGNTANGKTATHTYTQDGSYTVTLTAAVGGGGCQDQVVKENYIHVGTYKSDFEVPKGCAKVPLTFKNTSNPLPESATWDFGDGTTASGIDIKHTFKSPGTYQVTLTNDFDGCQRTVTKSITTYPSPTADFKVTQNSFCDTPAVVSFQNLSQGATSWKWRLGDKDSIMEKQPTHTYAAGGDFDVTLIATNANGCVDSVTKQNYVHVEVPDLKFYASPGFGCVPFTTTFHLPEGSAAQIKNYKWDFGDGSPTSSDATPKHKYEKTGAFTVTLNVVTQSGCKQSFKRNSYIHVGKHVNVQFDAAPREVCLSDTVQFTNKSSPRGNGWVWYFPNDGDKTDSVENPLHHFSSLGKQDVKLRVNNNGCYSYLTLEDFITVKEPKAAFSWKLPSCSDRLTLKFEDESRGAEAWHWDFGDGGTSTDPNPSYTYATSGARKVTLTVTNGSCSSTTTQWVRVIKENPVLNISPQKICKGDTVTLTAGNIHIPEFVNSLVWNNGNGETKTTEAVRDEIPEVQFTYDQNGIYTPSLVVNYTNKCQSEVKGTPVIVQGPTAAFSMSDQNICQGSRVTFTGKSKPDPADAAIKQWIWDYDDGTIDTTSTGSATHDFKTGGNFNIKLTVTDVNGCLDESEMEKNNVLIVDNSKASFSTPDTLACPGSVIRWNNNSLGKDLSYLWDFGNGTTSTERIPQNISYSKDSAYTVSLKITTDEGCMDDTIIHNYITVGTPKAVMDDTDGIKICRILKDTAINLSQNYKSILWDFGDGTTSDRDTAYHIYNVPGTYTQKLIVNGYSEGCKNEVEREITITGPVGKAIIDDMGGCNPHTVHFSAKNVTTAVWYQWDFGNGVFSDSSKSDNATYTYKKTGDYHPRLILTDAQNCKVFIPINDTLNVIVDSVGLRSVHSWPEVCDSNKVVFGSKGMVFSVDSLGQPAEYHWDFGDPSTLNDVSNEATPAYRYRVPGTYYPTLKINTQYGCEGIIKDTVNIPDSTLLKVTATADPVDICAGDSVHLQVSSNIGLRYVWSPAERLNDPNATQAIAWPATTTTYQVTAFSKANCQSTTANINVVVHKNPEVATDSVLSLPTGSVVQLKASGSPDITQWEWSPSDYLSCTFCASPTSTPRKPLTYVVTVMNQFGCTDTSSVKINLVCAEGKVFIPNTFTPNNDGMNDVFYPRGRGVREVVYFRIYNRWGQLVYERTHFQINNITAGWKGKFKGKRLNPEVFIYQAAMICDNGKLFHLKGDVTLLR